MTPPPNTPARLTPETEKYFREWYCPDNGDCGDGMEMCFAEIDALRAEIARLRSALEAIKDDCDRAKGWFARGSRAMGEEKFYEASGKADAALASVGVGTEKEGTP